MSDQPAVSEGPEHRVKSLELFFDLVFVLAFTQVTTKLADDLSYQGMLRSLLVLAVLWWAWAGYAWLTNAFDPESKLMRLPIFVAMAALLIASLAVPQAFGEYAAYFAVAYMIVRLIHVSFYLIGSRGDKNQFRAVMRLMPIFILAPALILVSVAFDGQVQAAFWVLAIVVDYGGAFVFAGDGWNLEPEHFAERFGLIIIIALGESIVSIGVGAEGVTLDAETVLAAVLAITLASAMWWMYFDVLAIVAARVLHQLSGLERSRMALHTYAMLHFLLIAGIIFSALAIKKTVGHPEEHLKEIPAVALGLGIALYAGGLAAIRKRDIGKWNGFRLIVAALALALIPVFKEVTALASISIVTAILLVLVATEAWYYRDVRARVRSTA
ncbi:MAG: low temperature requirement protein A [Solirubrobacterales bacterium]